LGLQRSISYRAAPGNEIQCIALPPSILTARPVAKSPVDQDRNIATPTTGRQLNAFDGSAGDARGVFVNDRVIGDS
jgi:hypothetical protein